MQWLNIFSRKKTARMTPVEPERHAHPIVAEQAIHSESVVDTLEPAAHNVRSRTYET